MSEFKVVQEWAVEYSFDPGAQAGVRREWRHDELVEERAVTLDEALSRELHPTIRELLDERP